MDDQAQHAQWLAHHGFSSPQEISLSTHHRISNSHISPPPFHNAIAHIQDLFDQDDAETPLSSLHDVIAYHSTASELASILNEDSPSLCFNLASYSAQCDTPKQHPLAVQDLVASLPRSLAEPLAEHVVLSNIVKDSESLDDMPSKVFEVELIRSMLSTRSTACERCKTEVSDVDQHPHCGIKRDEAKRAINILKRRKDYCVNKPRLCNYGSMSIRKQTYYDKFVALSIHTTGLPTDIHLHDMLLQCAYAVGLNNTVSAMAIACRLKQQASPHGSTAERLAYYFIKALYARFQGIGWSLYTGHLSQHRPSLKQILEASLKYMSSCPFAKACHFLANQTILRVARGASTLHIVEHQLTGIQYPSLFKALAALPTGPPKVQLVGIVVPHYSMLPDQQEVICTALEEIGRRLSKCARALKVPFQFTSWVGARENIRLQDFVSSKRRPDEVLVLIYAFFLRFVMDDILDPLPVRIRSFRMIRDANPDVYIQGIVSGAYSSPFYSTRFKEALFHFACIYDVLDTFTKRDDEARLVFESEVLGKAILNIVACEGSLVSRRVEKYKQWQAYVEEVGMQQLPMDKDIIHKVQGLLQSWHKDYMAVEDRQYLLLGWKGRILYALSVWKSPSRPG